MAYKQIGERSFNTEEEYAEFCQIVDEQLKIWLQNEGRPEDYQHMINDLSATDCETLYNNHLRAIQEADARRRKEKEDPRKSDVGLVKTKTTTTKTGNQPQAQTSTTTTTPGNQPQVQTKVNPTPNKSKMAEPVSGSQLATIPNYNGETPVELFIRQVERSQVQFGWTAEQTAAAIKNKMIGAAGAWLQGEELSLSEMKTWNQLKALMITRFKVNTSQMEAVASIINLRQKEKETCMEFYDRVCIAVDKKNSNYEDKDKQTVGYRTHYLNDVYTMFAAGLRADVRVQVLSSNNPPTTAAELRKAANITEAQILSKKSTIAELGIEELMAKLKTEDTEEEKKEVTTKAFQMKKKKRFNQERTDSACYACNGKGHFAKHCPNRRRGFENRFQRRGDRGFRRYSGRGFRPSQNRFPSYNNRRFQSGGRPRYTQEMGPWPEDYQTYQDEGRGEWFAPSTMEHHLNY